MHVFNDGIMYFCQAAVLYVSNMDVVLCFLLFSNSFNLLLGLKIKYTFSLVKVRVPVRNMKAIMCRKTHLLQKKLNNDLSVALKT